MDNRHLASAAFLVVLLLLISIPGQADDTPVDVCPANSAHKSLPFLKSIKPGALSPLISNGLNQIDMSAVTDFIKTTLVPVIGANVFFFALEALLLIIFILWRLLRWCCVVCCCRGSCDLKRSKHDPGELLFGQRMKINKGFMLVFGLVAVAFAVYGLVTVEKSVTDGAFNVLTSVSDYATDAFDTLDALLDTIGSTSNIIDRFQAVVTLDLEVDSIVANLTGIGAFLQNAPTPTSLLASVNGLTTRAADLGTALAQLQAGLSTFTSNATGTAGRDRFTTIAQAPGNITQMNTTTDAVLTALSNVNLAIASPTNASAVALRDQLVAMRDNMQANDWVTQLDDLTAALTFSVGTQNPYSTLKAQAVTVKDTASDVNNTKVPALISSINSLVSEYAVVSPKMSGLLVKLQFINTTILELPAAMQSAYANLNSAKANMDNAMTANPSPSSIANNLTNFKNSMPSLAALDTLITNLSSTEADLYTQFPNTSTTAYLAWIADTRQQVLNMRGASLASGNLVTLIDLVQAFVNGTSATYPKVKHGEFATWAAAARTNFTNAPSMVADYAVKAQGFVSSPLPAADTTAASNSTSSAQGSITSLPNTAALVTNLGSVKTAYDALGTPPSAVVDQPRDQLLQIKNSAMTEGNAVKAQITDTVNNFKGTTGNLKQLVVNQVTDIKGKYQEPAKTYDGYRYIASMALYGVSILFVALIFVSCLANYHFGTNFSTLLLLLITILYFLLALIIALLIAALYMGCGELEPLAVRLAPAKFTPLLRYYFYNEGSSVSVVLKNAGIVDIDQVRGQVENSKSKVVSGLTGTFNWRDNPSNPRSPFKIIGDINATIDTAMGHVDRLIDKAGRTQMFKMYSEVKGYLCCSVPDMLSPLWTGLTMAGVFAVLLIICTFFYISKIDKAPRQDCCGCTCHTRSKYAGTVQPGGEVLPQYASPGWEQGPGYVPPNGAMAMHVPWISEDHGTVNVMVAGPNGLPKTKAG